MLFSGNLPEGQVSRFIDEGPRGGLYQVNGAGRIEPTSVGGLNYSNYRGRQIEIHQDFFGEKFKERSPTAPVAVEN